MAYDTCASAESLERVVAGLAGRGVEAVVVETKADALMKIKEYIPAGASVMNGASTTLEQVGFVEYLKAGEHGWNNLHAAILAEKDPITQAQLRRASVLSDYYLGSVHALAETGEFIVASNTGSQLPHIVYTSPNLIFVVGSQKVVSTLEAAAKRLEDYVIPLEDKRMMAAYNMHTTLNKIVVWKGESAFTGRKARMIIVKEEIMVTP